MSFEIPQESYIIHLKLFECRSSSAPKSLLRRFLTRYIGDELKLLETCVYTYKTNIFQLSFFTFYKVVNVHSIQYDACSRALIGLRVCPEESLATDWLASYSATEHALFTIGYLSQFSWSELTGRVSLPRCDAFNLKSHFVFSRVRN